ncbi:hypothetical protein ACFL35_03795 [Candidatus Riflebacteria bacterium]
MTRQKRHLTQIYGVTGIVFIIVFILSYVLEVSPQLSGKIRFVIHCLIPVIMGLWGYFIIPLFYESNEELESFRGDIFRRMIEVLNEPDMNIRMGLFNSMLTTVVVPEDLPVSERIKLLESNKIAFELLEKHLSPPERSWVISLKNFGESSLGIDEEEKATPIEEFFLDLLARFGLFSSEEERSPRRTGASKKAKSSRTKKTKKLAAASEKGGKKKSGKK